MRSRAQLGFLPLVAPLALAAKSSIVTGFVSSVGGVLAKFGVGDTKTDKERKANAARLLEAATSGDMNAFAALIQMAFERKPDGKFSPKAVQELAKHALQTYVQVTRAVPPQFQQYAARLGASAALSQRAIEEALLVSGKPFNDSAGALSPVPGSGDNTKLVVIAAAVVAGLLIIPSVLRRRR